MSGRSLLPWNWRAKRVEESDDEIRVSVELPGVDEKDVDAERAEASFRKGVLEVKLPKSVQARSGRRIEVRAG